MEKAARNVHAEPIELLKARVRDLFQKQGWEFDEDMSAELKAFLAYKYPEFGIGSLHTLQNWTPEEYLNSLSLPKKGSSFKERTIEQIAAEVPGVFTTVIEIVNHLDVELTDYQLHLYAGSKHQEAPNSVAFKTREVFTFEYEIRFAPRGVFLYRVGDTGFSLHLLFGWNEFAVGFLENNASVKTFEPIYLQGFKYYTHTGPPDSFKYIERFKFWENSTRTVTINVGAIYAKLTVQSKPSDSVDRLFYTIEIFKFDP